MTRNIMKTLPLIVITILSLATLTLHAQEAGYDRVGRSLKSDSKKNRCIYTERENTWNITLRCEKKSET